MARILYTYWRSQASYRVRIALALKGLDFQAVTLDLLKGEQFAASYRDINPEMVVPAFVDGDGPPLVQSMAILEYLEETHPEPPLLPADPRARAHARAIAGIVAADAHPLIVPRVRKYLQDELKLDEPVRQRWISHWMDTASHAADETLARSPLTGRFCCGDRVTVADICLVAHFTSAIMLYKADVTAYPTASRIYDACMDLDAFATTHPLRQPDAPN